MRKVLKKLLLSIRGGYKPKVFWDNWAETFMEDRWQVETHAQHAWMLSKIKALKPERIVEIGCGFGRNIKFLINQGIEADRITGVDISPKMIRKAKRYIQNKRVQLIVADGKKLPFKDNAFDVSLVHGVLMHVKSDEVEEAVREILRVTKNIMIAVEQNYESDNTYTFIHDYKKLFKELGVNIVEFVNNKKDGLDYFYVKVR